MTVTLFTCPADRTAIVKEISVAVTVAVAASIIRIEATYSGSGARVVDRFSGAATTSVEIRPRWFVLQETDTLQVFVPAGVTVQIAVSGTLLDGDPS